MKVINMLVGIALLGATLGLGAAPAGAADGVLFKVEVSDGYCHMQFRAMKEDSYHSPVFQDADSSDIIDYYGPCDHDPLGRQEMLDQRSERFTDDDAGNDSD